MSDLTQLAGRIAAREAAAVPPLRPSCEARVVWARAPATQTDLSIVYIHGFSASPEEIRPVPDLLAQALGANLHFARLTGHGQDGEALAAATLPAWERDVAEALKVGRSLGRRTLLMGCSTGCTLATLAAAKGAELAGVIHVSPNFAMASRLVQWVLDAPGVARWGPWVTGRSRSFEPISEAHSAYWTTEYPTRALWPMADALRAVRRAKLGTITTPALFVFCEQDTVVSAAETRRVMARWGGPVKGHVVTMGPGDDVNGHVIAGDIFSPSQTGPVVDIMTGWARAAL